MIAYLVILIFILSVAIAAGSIMVSSKLRTSYKADFFSSLIFLQAFYFTYGFYAIWGQILFTTFLSPFISNEVLDKAVNILVLLGSPFAVFSWFMLLKFTRELSGRNMRESFIIWYLVSNVLLAGAIGLVLSEYAGFNPFSLIKYGFILLNLLYSFIAAGNLIFWKKNKIVFRKNDMRNLAFGIILFMLLQNSSLMIYDGNVYRALLFIFMFFITGAFIPVYIRYKSDLSVLLAKSENKMSFELLCESFAVSPREQEIIRELCNGLSNQQIADKLFISLQTVKDHTHRIYYKTNCSSRSQLIALVNEKSRTL
jgi:DNA-binding CsgD family transcriptional regulator